MIHTFSTDPAWIWRGRVTVTGEEKGPDIWKQGLLFYVCNVTYCMCLFFCMCMSKVLRQQLDYLVLNILSKKAFHLNLNFSVCSSSDISMLTL